MCGINGFTWKDASLIEKMNGALKHRGPDDQSTYIDENISLGHRRLSIIDLSQAGRQPMENEDGSIWIVFNGEVYNFGEIRSELAEKGHKFRSNTDTEVIIHAYEEWGCDSVERFNGMWAFALYDKAKNLLFLSRDRFGVKPLYYYYDDNGLIFSSEIKGILQHGIDRKPSDKAIYDYLALGFVDHSPETFFKGLFRLAPGGNLIYDLSSRSVKIWQWYDLRERLEEIKGLCEVDLAKRVRDIFEDSVRYRLISDVPVGSCLSGGIDSSAIVYAMRNLNNQAEIKTFSMVFPGRKIDESSYVDEVVKDTKVEPHRISPSPEDLLKDLNDLIWTQEEPFRTPSIYGQYKVMELAHKNGMKVLLDGQGSDELFAGYFIYYKYYLFESLLNLRLDEFSQTVQAIGDKLNDMVIFPLATVLSRLGLSNWLLKHMWLKRAKYLNNFEDTDLANPLPDRGFSLNRALYSDLTKYSIPQLLRYEDKNSMRWSIETRVPFLDYRFVELAMSLPSSCKIQKGVTKHILRKALRDMVSPKILQRRDKLGFVTPDDDWLSTPVFREMVERMISSSQFKSRRYWKQEEAAKLIEEHLSGKKNHSEEIWRILNTELWLRTFIDRTIQTDLKISCH
jgi:asparagine synthase (glutamine-hydrolysing)